MGTGISSVVVVTVNAARTRSNTTLHDMYVKNMKEKKEEEKKGEAGEQQHASSMHRWKG